MGRGQRSGGDPRSPLRRSIRHVTHPFEQWAARPKRTGPTRVLVQTKLCSNCAALYAGLRGPPMVTA
ncbi:MAG: hypothetical protein A2138_26680 [Deltaproteobacteria bacterium RBG_16_71_12]|nr:MAG: hypothetical protein A2138_26680 [Deltaproteobacteria bacterium RBG_16_71_12]